MKIRGIELLRAGWGAVLLTVPGIVLASLRGVQVDRKALIVARILGARHIVQALASGINPSPETLAAGVWVDTVHAMTALGLAAVDRDRAQGGVADAIVAASWAGLGWHHLHTGKAARTTATTRDELARKVIGNLPGGGRLMDQALRVRAEQLS